MVARRACQGPSGIFLFFGVSDQIQPAKADSGPCGSLYCAGVAVWIRRRYCKTQIRVVKFLYSVNEEAESGRS